MSLRFRLIASIVLVLLVSLCVGGAAAGWHAVRSVSAELQAALAVGAQTVRNGIDAVKDARDPQTERERLMHIFDGDRHVRAVLRDASGQIRAESTLRGRGPGVPAWFVAFLAPSIAPVRLDAGDGAAITVEPDPRNEIGEVWTQFQDDLVAAGLTAGLSVVLISLVVGRALRPLDRLSAALASLGHGEFAVRVPHVGPPELARLAQGFNAMVERLAVARAVNLRLNEQLLTLQEEERTELARDLHDEVGPFLFAVHLDVAAIEQAAASGQAAAISERTRAIREAVGHMQHHVRAMLHRLRPASPVDVGLTTALGNLAAFWRARRPEIAIMLDVSVDEDIPGGPTMAAIYRLVQEGLSNAVRHGGPRRIEVTVRHDDSGEIVVRVTDDGTGLRPSDEPGLGFTGMRERVEGLGGRLHIGPGDAETGLVISAWLPCPAVMEDA